jgi:thiol-disulfide isomerase/thioredoxin
MKSKLIPLLLYIIFCTCSNICAQDDNKQLPQLTVGGNAPELKIEKWVKEGGFIPLKKGKVYLIDLWATWCVPCIAGMPHLSMLQAKYKEKGLEVIGITSEDKYGNTFDNVQDFVRKKNSLMNYNVAWVPVSEKDSVKGIWLHPWMQMSGSGNLPTTFLIDRNGKVVYIGDPLTIDETLDEVVNGHYDMSALKTNYTEGINAENTLSEFNTSIKSKNYDEAIKYGKHLLFDFTYVKPNTYLVMGYQVAHIENVSQELLNMGYEAAQRGVILTKFVSPAFLDVLASIYAAKLDYVSAVIDEKLAVSMSEGTMKEDQTKRLEKYLSLILKNKMN